MDNDDVLLGRLFTRREALKALGLGGVSLSFLAACGSGTDPELIDDDGPGNPTATCVARPQLTEGPYFVDERLNRSDIRLDPTTNDTKSGVPLILTFAITRLSGSTCAPASGLFVDVWQCDGLGNYSDVGNTLGQKFLRGYQVTQNGIARFTTIYPGWYTGRATHIHFKVRNVLSDTSALEFNSQLFFPETLTQTVHAQLPYAPKGQADTTNARDAIYNQGGSQLLLAPVASGNGYTADFHLALQY
jgi:protocatechuate 3,4-dioxygenase beta subunit